MRRTLVLRLVLATILVTAVSVVGTVWLTQTTQAGYNLPRADRNLLADAEITRELTSWGATHSDWADAAPLVERLSAEHDRRIAIVSGDAFIVDTHPRLPLPEHARERVDVWGEATERSTEGADDPVLADVPLMPAGVAGAFALDTTTRGALLTRAQEVASCLGLPVERAVSIWPNGRPVVAPSASPSGCGIDELNRPTPVEQSALDELTTITGTCLIAKGEPPVSVVLDTEPDDTGSIRLAIADGEGTRAPAVGTERDCLAAAVAEQTQPFVAPAVSVFLTDERGDVRGPLDLSPGSIARIAVFTAVMLAFVLLTAWFVGAPVVRQIRAVSGAARRLANGDHSAVVPVSGTGEVADLAVAFNAMTSELRASREQQDQMISDVAHELRTPITNLRGWLEGAQDGVVDVDAGLVDLLHSETMRLQRIAADLQTLTMAEAGRLALHPEPIVLADLLDDAARSARPAATAAGITVTTEAERGLIVVADPLRVRQIVDNLVANAIQHSHGTTIAVRATRDTTPSPADGDGPGGSHGDLLVTVADDGRGVDDSVLPHLFDRFRRADSARSRSDGGSGLGLAIARQLAQAHGGTIDARNRTPHGFEVTVHLPTRPRAATASDTEHLRAESDGQ